MKICINYDRHPDYPEAKQIVCEFNPVSGSIRPELKLEDVLNKKIAKVEMVSDELVLTLE